MSSLGDGGVDEMTRNVVPRAWRGKVTRDLEATPNMVNLNPAWE